MIIIFHQQATWKGPANIRQHYKMKIDLFSGYLKETLHHYKMKIRLCFFN
jgi:hypothetical protein